MPLKPLNNPEFQKFSVASNFQSQIFSTIDNATIEDERKKEEEGRRRAEEGIGIGRREGFGKKEVGRRMKEEGGRKQGGREDGWTMMEEEGGGKREGGGKDTGRKRGKSNERMMARGGRKERRCRSLIEVKFMKGKKGCFNY